MSAINGLLAVIWVRIAFMTDTDLAESALVFRRAVGSAIAERRKELELSQAALAEAARISQTMVSRLESGATWASGETLYNIADALKLHPEELAKFADVETAPVEYLRTINGAVLRKTRMEADITREQLARQLDGPAASVTPWDITAFENGAAAMPFDFVLEIAHALNVAPERIAPLPIREKLQAPTTGSPPADASHDMSAMEFLALCEERGVQLTRRERHYLGSTKFETENWFTTDDAFWMDLLEFWRRQIKRNE